MPDESANEAASRLLSDRFDLNDCSRCDRRYEWGLVMGDDECAVGVAVCPNCGYTSTLCTADPGGVISEYPYRAMHDLALSWVPPWYPGEADVTPDRRCVCGKTWRTRERALEHVFTEHPHETRLRLVEHDRYPWRERPADAE